MMEGVQDGKPTNILNSLQSLRQVLGEETGSASPPSAPITTNLLFVSMNPRKAGRLMASMEQTGANVLRNIESNRLVEAMAELNTLKDVVEDEV